MIFIRQSYHQLGGNDITDFNEGRLLQLIQMLHILYVQVAELVVQSLGQVLGKAVKEQMALVALNHRSDDDVAVHIAFIYAGFRGFDWNMVYSGQKAFHGTPDQLFLIAEAIPGIHGFVQYDFFIADAHMHGQPGEQSAYKVFQREF